MSRLTRIAGPCVAAAIGFTLAPAALAVSAPPSGPRLEMGQVLWSASYDAQLIGPNASPTWPPNGWWSGGGDVFWTGGDTVATVQAIQGTTRWSLTSGMSGGVSIEGNGTQARMFAQSGWSLAVESSLPYQTSGGGGATICAASQYSMWPPSPPASLSVGFRTQFVVAGDPGTQLAVRITPNLGGIYGGFITDFFSSSSVPAIHNLLRPLPFASPVPVSTSPGDYYGGSVAAVPTFLGAPYSGLRIFRNDEAVLALNGAVTTAQGVGGPLVVLVQPGDSITVMGSVSSSMLAQNMSATPLPRYDLSLTNFSADLLIASADPIDPGDPGTAPTTPITPPTAPSPPPLGSNIGPTWSFDPFLIPGTGPGTDTPLFFDPDYAVGYRYETAAGSPAIASITLPELGDNRYDLYTVGADWDDLTLLAADVLAGVEYVFTTPVTRIVVMGIDPVAAVDPEDPNGFVTGLTFSGGGIVQLEMTAIVPEPAMTSLMMLAAATLLRRRPRAC